MKIVNFSIPIEADKADYLVSAVKAIVDSAFLDSTYAGKYSYSVDDPVMTTQTDTVTEPFAVQVPDITATDGEPIADNNVVCRDIDSAGAIVQAVNEPDEQVQTPSEPPPVEKTYARCTIPLIGGACEIDCLGLDDATKNPTKATLFAKDVKFTATDVYFTLGAFRCKFPIVTDDRTIPLTIKINLHDRVLVLSTTVVDADIVSDLAGEPGREFLLISQ